MTAARRPVRVAIVGAGFAAALHVDGYRRLDEAQARVVGVAASSAASAEAFARVHGIPSAYGEALELIRREDVDLVDLCTPNALHEPLALAAARAGKHIVCEKPLTGYFGGTGAAEPVGATPRSLMLREALASARRMLAAAAEHGVQLMYAENWLYSPGIVKANRLVAASGGAILEIRGQECHSGSHARYSRAWSQAGGGALLRLGSHPIGAALWLKAEEGLRRDGRPIRARAVTAEVGDLSKVAAFQRESEHALVDAWEDVENWASLVITFEDDTRAVISASDVVLGGIEDTLQVMASNCRVDCDMSHSGLLRAYAPREGVFGDEYLMEKISTQAGWSYPSVDEEYLLGYPQEIEEFVGCVAEAREPRSTGKLGLEVLQVIYAGYQSAEEGRRVALESIET